MLPKIPHEASGDTGGDPLEECLPLFGRTVSKGAVGRRLARQEPLLHEPVRHGKCSLIVRRRVEGIDEVADGGGTKAPDGFHDARFEFSQHARQAATVEIEPVNIHMPHSTVPNDERVVLHTVRVPQRTDTARKLPHAASVMVAFWRRSSTTAQASSVRQPQSRLSSRSCFICSAWVIKASISISFRLASSRQRFEGTPASSNTSTRERISATENPRFCASGRAHPRAP